MAELALTIGDLKKRNGIEEDEFNKGFCGNCVHYKWSYDGDRHKGMCAIKDNDFATMVRVTTGIHAMTQAGKHCEFFDNNIEQNEDIITIHVKDESKPKEIVDLNNDARWLSNE